MSVDLGKRFFLSAEWDELKAHLTERLRQHRERNDTALSDLDTAKLRGQISEIKALLDLEDKAIDPERHVFERPEVY